jgi:hypothetical protein
MILAKDKLKILDPLTSHCKIKKECFKTGRFVSWFREFRFHLINPLENGEALKSDSLRIWTA